MRKILITGGNGFIGRNLVSAIIERNEIKNIDILDIRPPVGYDYPEGVKWIQGDIRTPIPTDLFGEYDLCYHLAALSKEPGYSRDEYYATNVEGTRNVLQLLNGIHCKHIVFTSTMMVYATSDLPQTEESRIVPRTHYGTTKYIGECLCRIWQSELRNRQADIVRPAVVYGPYEEGNFLRLLRSLQGRYFFYIGRKTTRKSAVYVDDLNDFLLFMANKKGRWAGYSSVNVAYPYSATISEIVSAFADAFDISANYPVLPYSLARTAANVAMVLDRIGLKNPVHPRRIEKLYESTNISSELSLDLGFRYRYSLRDGIEEWKNRDSRMISNINKKKTEG